MYADYKLHVAHCIWIAEQNTVPQIVIDIARAWIREADHCHSLSRDMTITEHRREIAWNRKLEILKYAMKFLDLANSPELLKKSMEGRKL